MKWNRAGLMLNIAGLILSCFTLQRVWGQVAKEQVILISESEPLQESSANANPTIYNTHAYFNDPDTLTFSPDQPFFDDFSQGGLYPDSTKWWLSSVNGAFPLKSRFMAINPPSFGVLTFDGLNSLGLPYNTQILERGVADELRSHYIDLSGFGPEDNIYLSFFVQPQGTGNAPEPEDEFKVLFTLQDQPMDSLREMLKISGEILRPFRQYVIPIDNPDFFHTQFQIVFQNIGSRNGLLDLWHLDYVLLGAGRSEEDTFYNDLSIVNTKINFFEPYSAYPAIIYPPANLDQPSLEIQVKNLDGLTRTINIDGTLSESSSNSIKFEKQFTLKPLGEEIENTSLGGSLSGLDTEYGSLKLAARITEQDDVTENNTLITTIPIDSIMAYDDGEADATYGITQPKGFGVKYTLPDSGIYELSAVWMSFVPLFNPSQVGSLINYMDGKGFRLVVWNAPDPGSTLINQIGSTRVIYGDSLNHFHRFALQEPVVLPDTFWVGIQQTDGLPIGIGYDLTIPKYFTYWDSAGIWVLSRIGGTPMIRPEIRLSGTPTSLPATLIKENISLTVYPNPVKNEPVILNWENNLRELEINIFNIQGEPVTTRSTQVSSGNTVSLDLSDLASGFYWLELTGIDNNGRVRYGVSKLIKE